MDRGALPAPDWSLRVPRTYVPPQSRLEMEVQLIWQAVLNKRDMISCNADFSELGGNMMHAVISNGIVREVMGVHMPALAIFRERTIQNVASRIRLMRRQVLPSSILCGTSAGAVPVAQSFEIAGILSLTTKQQLWIKSTQPVV